MTNPSFVPHRVSGSPFSVRARFFRVILWLLALSFVVTLLTGLIAYPTARTLVDPSAPNRDSDDVLVRGLPKFYLVSDPSVARPPAAALLVRHFAADWVAFFLLFAVPVFGLELIRIVAFFAARLVRAHLHHGGQSRGKIGGVTLL